MYSEAIKIQTLFNEHESSREGENERAVTGVRLSGDLTLVDTYATAQGNEFSRTGGPMTLWNNAVYLEGGVGKVIDIELIDEKGELIPRKRFQGNDKNWDYYIKAKTTSLLNHHISTTDYGWRICWTSPSTCGKPVICNLLPKKWYMFPVRILLLPVEWTWHILKCLWGGVKLTLVSLGIPLLKSVGDPKNTSVTVGDEEE